MSFLELLSTLSRSSAQAVSTLKTPPEEIEKLRDYLYVDTDIETQFEKFLESSLSANSIVFLCGSSGDGKSEILRRHYKKYSDDYRFHLDATHSFRPDQNAVDALDQLFYEHKASEKPLVVGINIGMMLNFQKTGAERHIDIKDAIGRFVTGERSIEQFRFFNFEDYPKFCLDKGNVGSSFISKLLAKVTAEDDTNPLYVAYKQDSANENRIEYHNYRLLQEESIQAHIVKILLHVRLKYDLFFSTRAILDFIYNLICGGSTLFENLFSTASGGISASVSNLDPCLRRSQRIDEFIVLQSLSVDDADFEEFKSEYWSRYGECEHNVSASGWVRAFYLLQGIEFQNNYPQQFATDFRDPLFEHYINIWQLHQSLDDKKSLRDFYDKTLISSLRKFANRLASKRLNDTFFIAERNGVTISANVRISLDTKRLPQFDSARVHCFYAAIKVDNHPLKPFPITVAFLELAERIMAGYRPNRHDKNAVVILEEVIEEVTRVASKSNRLCFNSHDERWELLLEDDEFVLEATS